MHRGIWNGALLVAGCLIAAGNAARAAPQVPVPVIIDTDVGSDVDDALALGLALLSPADGVRYAPLQILGITTCGSDPQTRALMVCRLLTMTNHDSIPVAAGADPQPKRPIEGQFQYRYHPDVIFNRTAKPQKVAAAELMFDQLQAHPGEITLVALGPLTNLAELLEKHPEAKRWIKQIVLKGGTLRRGADGQPPTEPELNLRSDVKAAQAVFASGVPLVVVPLDATVGLKAGRAEAQRLLSAGGLVSNQVRTLWELADRPDVSFADALVVAVAYAPDGFADFEEHRLEVTDRGMLRSIPGETNARVAVTSQAEKFRAELVDRFRDAAAPRTPADKEPAVVRQPIARGRFPSHVHAGEDYETDIERRWWMVGRPESENIPPASRRACRGVLTHDFDDLQGNRRAMYRAVIFNPVPGPPVGSATRLTFRYWLQGTDRLRVQLYSLTNGYHRCLTLAGLAQGSWREATVDMTEMRRPDGSGGPLAKDERIDDIQFYADPQAELIIDDILLYDAAAADETRPFPARVLFSGWFDTGKQGVEWPGQFEIVPHDPPDAWKAAQSLVDPAGGPPRLQVGLRGERVLRNGPGTGPVRLDLRYRLRGADRCGVELTLAGQAIATAQLAPAAGGRWSTATLEFAEPAQSDRPAKADEIRFVLSPGAELTVDDLLLYNPGAAPGE